jgi:hypothetical protein
VVTLPAAEDHDLARVTTERFGVLLHPLEGQLESQKQSVRKTSVHNHPTRSEKTSRKQNAVAKNDHEAKKKQLQTDLLVLDAELVWRRPRGEESHNAEPILDGEDDGAL